MLKVFNTQALTKNQRFQRAVLVGSVTALCFGLIYGLIANSIRLQFPIVFVAMGYGIGMAIRTYGRGVQAKFSILGAVCAVCCFLIADLIALGGLAIFTNFSLLPYVFRLEFARLFATNVNSLLALLYRVVGVYFAYINSRIV